MKEGAVGKNILECVIVSKPFPSRKESAKENTSKASPSRKESV